MLFHVFHEMIDDELGTLIVNLHNLPDFSVSYLNQIWLLVCFTGSAPHKHNPAYQLTLYLSPPPLQQIPLLHETVVLLGKYVNEPWSEHDSDTCDL